ncbi:MAG: alpha/beta fold hydrolase [Thermodesulfobacteriota bacterium]
MRLAHATWVPSGDGPHPTIFALHGFGSNAFDLLGLAPHLLGGRALVIAPQGPEDVALDVPGGARVMGHGWFPLTLTSPPTPLAVAQAIMAAREFVEQASDRYPIDRGRTVALGFSQGGVIAYALALADPQRFRALVALSSWLPDDLARGLPSADRSRLAAWVQHGTRDEVITAGRGRDSVAKLGELGVQQVAHREYDMAHEVSAESLTDLDAWLRAQLG